jgi:hypothetical protein
MLIWAMQPPGAKPYFAGGLIVGGAWLLSWFVSQDGFDRMRLGAEAERWTSSALRTLRRSGWSVVDSVLFEGFDVDHVLVGPGGVFAIETKFTSMPWRERGGALVGPFGDPIGQTVQGARKVRLLLGSMGHVVRVTPVLLAWGKGSSELRRGIIDGVMVIPGSELKRWMSEIRKADNDILPSDEVHAIRLDLESFIRERDEYERTASR